MNKVIGLDFDMVIADWLTPFLKFMNIIYNKNYTIEDLERKSIPEMYNISTDLPDIMKFGNNGEYYNLKPIVRALRYFKILQILGNKVGVITARQSEFTNDSLRWFDKYGIQPDFFEITQDKLPVCQKHGVTHFVDDRFKTCLETAGAGIETYLFSWPHNEFHKCEDYNITRVSNWDFLARELIGKRMGREKGDIR